MVDHTNFQSSTLHLTLYKFAQTDCNRFHEVTHTMPLAWHLCFFFRNLKQDFRWIVGTLKETLHIGHQLLVKWPAFLGPWRHILVAASTQWTWQSSQIWMLLHTKYAFIIHRVKGAAWSKTGIWIRMKTRVLYLWCGTRVNNIIDDLPLFADNSFAYIGIIPWFATMATLFWLELRGPLRGVHFVIQIGGPYTPLRKAPAHCKCFAVVKQGRVACSLNAFPEPRPLYAKQRISSVRLMAWWPEEQQCKTVWGIIRLWRGLQMVGPTPIHSVTSGRMSKPRNHIIVISCLQGLATFTCL